MDVSKFGEAVQIVTQAFSNISQRIKQVELKLKTSKQERAIIEESGLDLGPGLGEVSIAGQIREIQMLEKAHLEHRVLINQKTVNLARMDYELKK